jgi:hypothetical protein
MGASGGLSWTLFAWALPTLSYVSLFSAIVLGTFGGLVVFIRVGVGRERLIILDLLALERTLIVIALVLVRHCDAPVRVKVEPRGRRGHTPGSPVAEWPVDYSP